MATGARNWSALRKILRRLASKQPRQHGVKINKTNTEDTQLAKAESAKPRSDGSGQSMFIVFAAVSVSLVIINKAVMQSFPFPG